MAKALVALHKQFEASSTEELVPGERAHEVRSLGAMGKELQHQAKHHRGRGKGPGRGIER